MEDSKMENITLKINGVEVKAPAGSTILEAARLANIEIPTLCFLKDINEIGACRMCVCEVKGARSLVASCVYQHAQGSGLQKENIGADPFQPSQKMPVLRPQR